MPATKVPKRYIGYSHNAASTCGWVGAGPCMEASSSPGRPVPAASRVERLTKSRATRI
jgi:hypothetical protein